MPDIVARSVLMHSDRGDEVTRDATTRDASGPRPRAATTLPERVGRYRVGDVLGRGGMGVVTRALDELTGEAVALKFLEGALEADDDDLQRVEREARLLAAVRHPNVALVQGVEEHAGRPVLVLELVEGETLLDAIARGPLPLPRALEIATQIASALDAAHALGIVHRDLKPANVKLASDGSAKVLDFGLACRLDSAAPRSLASEAADLASEGLAGSFGYMPPERLRGETSGSTACDAWAVGCLLYEMLAGAAAFPGRTAGDRVRRTLEVGADLARLPPETPPHVLELIARCLAPEPELRPCGDGEIVAALGGVTLARPAAASPSTRSSRLPRPRSTFVGRASDVATIAHDATSPGLVTITGGGGSGKTRVALEAGLVLEAAGRRVTLVELALLPGESPIAQHAATALGLADARDSDATESILAKLAESDDVLLLDNAEHVLATTSALVERVLASCPRASLVVTSREPLRLPSERVVQLAPLGSDDAVALFVERAHAARRSFRLDDSTAPHVERICRKLEGIPLAIELAAARTRAMSVEQVADALDQGFALVSGGSTAALPRHRALHATLEWSHALLDDEERFTYRRLAAFTGPFTLALAERVASDDGRPVAPAIARLVDKSLVVQSTGPRRTTWRLLEPVRQHAADKLAPDDALAARRALVDAMADLGSAMVGRLDGDDVAAASEDVAELHANVREALRFAAVSGDADRGITLMEHLATYWISRGLWREGREIVDALLDASPRRPRSGAAAHLLSGQFSMLLGESALARDRMLRALPWFRDAGDDEGLADALNALSQVEWQMMDLALARTHGEESLALRRRSGRRDMIANSLNNVGLIARAEGDLAGARRHLDECLAILRELGHAHPLAVTLGNVGTVALDQADHDAAERYLSESLEQARLCGSRRAELFALANLGAVACDLGRHDESLAREREAAAICRELSDRAAGMTILWTFARLAAASGDFERVAVLQGAGLALREALGARRFHGQERWDAMRERARSSLGAERYDAAFGQGRARSLDEALDALPRL